MDSNFGKNLKFLREKKNVSQEDVAKIVDKERPLVSMWESEKREPIVEDVIKLANYFEVPIDEMIVKNLKFDNATPIEIPSDILSIPVYGSITAGVPIETQEDISRYIEIPKVWTKPNKNYFALDVTGTSMTPKYCDNDTVVFEQCNFYQEADMKDSVVFVNCTEATFKKVYINENSITLQPYNTNNFKPTTYTKEQADNLPIRIVGIAIRRITEIN